MLTRKPSVLLLATLFGSACAAASGCIAEDPGAQGEDNLTESEPARFAPDQMDAEANYALWAEYCVGDQAATKRPVPKYDNPLVIEAAKQLSRVATHSFSMYGDINAHHKTTVPDDLASTISGEAHDFLGYLCGEFRDRASMVEAKISWVAAMNYLDDEDDGAYDAGGNPWRQMRAKDYEPYLGLSSSLWQARRARLDAEGRRYMKVGNLENIDTPVPGQTVCETKYMFAEYIRKDRAFDTLEAFESGYKTFREASCTLPDDEDWYYDFRGDSNIKPNSPESNGMIWFARTVAKQCDARTTAEPYRQARPESSIDAAVCERYFKYPFTERWNAARAGLATWVLVDPNGEGLDSNSTFTVFPYNVSEPSYMFGDKGPYQAKNGEGAPIKLLEGYDWSYSGFGLPELHQNDKESIHKLIQLAVDRHTDWYSSGYDDLMAYKPYKRDQAYSPFVASSYEMSESDGFVTPGTTVNAIDETAYNFKHWMFVFKIHRDNWYTPERINAEDVPVPDFDRYWFDETSFGESGLANSEKAWDRLGSALEAEYDTPLYLHNLPGN